MEDIDELMNDDQFENEELLDSQSPYEGSQSDGDLINSLLETKGIEDPSRIKFENDNGEIEEVDWNSLNDVEKLNILSSSSESDPETALNNQEIELLNAIRTSNLTPAEYLQYIGRQSIGNYIQQNSATQFKIDEYTDEELYVLDLLSKTEDITEQEALEALENSKANEALFRKQMDAVRSDYRKAEVENLRQIQAQQEYQAQVEFNRTAHQLQDEINNFTEFAGYEVNMDNDEKQDVYTFLVGHDNAGNSWLGKALKDKQSAVRMAWLTLYGEQMVQDITDYYKSYITQVRKNSYNKGVEDARNGYVNTVYRPKTMSKTSYDDLDNF